MLLHPVNFQVLYYSEVSLTGHLPLCLLCFSWPPTKDEWPPETGAAHHTLISSCLMNTWMNELMFEQGCLWITGPLMHTPSTNHPHTQAHLFLPLMTQRHTSSNRICHPESSKSASWWVTHCRTIQSPFFATYFRMWFRIWLGHVFGVFSSGLSNKMRIIHFNPMYVEFESQSFSFVTW